MKTTFINFTQSAATLPGMAEERRTKKVNLGTKMARMANGIFRSRVNSLKSALLLAGSLFSLNAMPQSCGGTFFTAPPNTLLASCTANSAAYQAKYGKQSFYVPTATDPLLTVNLTFHIFNDNAGAGNFQPTGPTWTQIDDIAHLLNNGYERQSEPRYANYTVPGFNPPTWTGLKDSRVMYVVTHIYFYNNTTMQNSANDNAILNHIGSVDPARLQEGLPIIFNYGAISGGAAGHAGSINNIPFVRTVQSPAAGGWFVYEHLRHEVGHCVGWMHTYLGGGSELQVGNTCGSDDFLTDVFPQNNTMCTAGTSPCNVCPEFQQSNNVMGGGFAGIPPCGPPFGCTGAGNNWMSNLQMGRRTRNLHLPYYGLRQFVKEMVSEHQYPWLITSNEEWDFDIQMYRDIVVKSGATLKITCRVAMATEGKIIVEKGAKLLIDGGEITGWCKKTPAGTVYNMPLWTGIEVDGNPALNQLINNTTGYCANQGIVEIKNGGIISHAFKGINTSLTSSTSGAWIGNTSGGIVIADGANFVNNVFDIIFYKYQLGNVRSKVINSSFITTAEIGRDGNGALITPHEHIKLYDNWGLKIRGCTFDYLAGATYPAGSRGVGLYTTDSHFEVNEYCSVSPCTSGTRCQFNNMTAGLWIDNFNPLYTGNVQHSDFTDNDRGVVVENCNYLSFFENNVTTNNGAIGMYLYRSKYYNISNNNFQGLWQQGAGIIVYDSKAGAHQIYNNTFSDFNVGILCQDDNSGMSSTGLRMNCNMFNTPQGNTYDITLEGYQSMPVIMIYQGAVNPTTGFDLVRNSYGAVYYNIPGLYNKYTIDPNCIQTINHPSTPNGDDNPNYPFNQASPQVNVFPYNIYFDRNTHCPAYPQSGGGGGSQAVSLNNMNSYLDALGNDVDNFPFEIQSTVASKMNLFLADNQQEYNDQIITVLENNQGNMDDADIQLIFAYMRSGDYSTAAAKINDLPADRADWMDMLTRMMEMKQNPDDIYGYMTDAITNSFADYANTEDRDGQACAQAILNFIGIGHDYPVVYPTAGNPDGRQAQVTGIAGNAAILPLHLYPNPTQNGITIEGLNAGNGALKIEISDVLGRVIHTEATEKQDKQYVSLGKMPTGVYLLKVLNEKNVTVYKAKIIKQD